MCLAMPVTKIIEPQLGPQRILHAWKPFQSVSSSSRYLVKSVDPLTDQSVSLLNTKTAFRWQQVILLGCK